MHRLLYRFSTTRIFAQIPFTYVWIIKKAIGNVRTVLDLGCAKGIFTEVIARNENWVIDGVEMYPDYIKDARKIGIYRRVTRGDITRLPKSILSKSYDVVLCHQVIEHISKTKGLKAIGMWEEMAKKRVVIGTTVGFVKYEQNEEINKPEAGNILLRHKSGWTPREFRELGYVVRGQGLRAIYGDNGLAKKSPGMLLPLFKIVSFVFAPLSYYLPSIAQVMICHKDIN